MTRLAPAALIAIWLVTPLIRWTAVGGGPTPLTGCREQTGSAIDHRSLTLLREKAVQERLGLVAEQKVEVGRLLALTLDSDQEDLIRIGPEVMVVGRVGGALPLAAEAGPFGARSRRQPGPGA
jgi:hypothetical protein